MLLHYIKRLRLRPPGLRTFIITLISLVMVPSLLLMLYTAWEQHRTAQHLAQQQLASLVQVAVNEQKQLISGTKQLLMSMSQLPTVQDPSRALQCQSLLMDLLKPHPYYTNFGVAGTNGDIYCSALPMDHQVNISDRLYFRRTISNKGFGIGEYQVGRITGEPSINFSYPFTDTQGNIQGVIFAALSLDWLRELVASSNLIPGTSLKIIDSNGHILVQYPTNGEDDRNVVAETSLYQHIQEHREKDGVLLTDNDKIERFYSYSPLIDSMAGIYVAAGIPEDSLTADVDQDFKRYTALMLLLSLIICGIAWVFSKSLFMQRIDTLTRAASKLRDGKLGIKTGLEHGNDELGYLAQTIDAMSESLYTHHNKLKMTSEELMRTNKALRTLSACNRTLVFAKDEQQLLDTMCQLIVEVGGYPAAYISVESDDASGGLEIIASAGTANIQAGLIFSSNEPIHHPANTSLNEIRITKQKIRPDSANQHTHAQHPTHASESIISLPLQINDRKAVLNIHALEINAFDEQEVELLEEMAIDIAFGIITLANQAKRIEAEAHIRHLAYYDPLTDLPNRYHLENRLAELINQNQSPLAIMMININRFNEINNTVGYGHADNLLKSFAPRLCEILQKDTYIARTGGDIFAVILPHHQHNMSLDIALRIQAVSKEPIETAGLTLDISVTIGIALFPDHGDDAITLIRRSSLAMHAAKQTHNYISIYNPSLDQDGPRRLTMATELRRAIKENKLQLYFQPKVDINSHTVVSVEALCRWNHPQHGMISPAEFIPIAEHTGLIVPLTLWVLREAVIQLHDWVLQDLHLPIAVNLSSRNLSQPDLINYIQTLCQEHDLPISMLELELTESDIMQDTALCKHTLDQLHKLGITLFIDDYGTGYSSLGYIKQLPMSAIKIDQSFVFDMQNSSDATTIIKSTIAMAHELGMLVIAEGVENKDVYEKLSMMGCDHAQGYYISRPLPNTEFLQWLAQGSWSLRNALGTDVTRLNYKQAK